MNARTIIAVSCTAVFLVAPAGADLIQVMQADRSLAVWASGYGWDFSDIDGDTAESVAISGVFSASFDVELFDYEGQHVARGIGSVDTDIACDSIRFRFDAEGISEQASVEEADGGAEANLAVLFDLAEPARVTFVGASNGAGEYAFGSGSLRRAGVPGPALAVVGFQHGYPHTAFFMDILEPGSYRVDADLTAWAFGGPNISAQCEGFVDVTITAHHLADADMSGAVDVDDLVSVILAFDTDDDLADVTRDGWVGIDDIVAVVTAWGTGCR